MYIANYCENYCVYCGFNCYNHIHRMKLSMEQIEHEMEIIAQSGMEEILLLTGESRSMSSVEYIGEACKLARKYFRMVGLEIYPVNTDEYRYLHECGADYVTVFQETYDRDKYETLHLMGHKRVWPYRFDAQERALRGGMRGVAFSALLGLADFRKDALASALHVYYLQRKYPAAEMSLSCPRLRPIINNDKINPLDVGERQLCQVLCAYRIFLPFVGITVSSREDAAFRNGIVRIAATKVSAGVSTGIGDHESKYQGKEAEDAGDEQFEISDSRSLSQMYQDMAARACSPSSTITSMFKIVCVTARALCPGDFLASWSGWRPPGWTRSSCGKRTCRSQSTSFWPPGRWRSAAGMGWSARCTTSPRQPKSWAPPPCTCPSPGCERSPRRNGQRSRCWGPPATAWRMCGRRRSLDAPMARWGTSSPPGASLACRPGAWSCWPRCARPPPCPCTPLGAWGRGTSPK